MKVHTSTTGRRRARFVAPVAAVMTCGLVVGPSQIKTPDMARAALSAIVAPASGPAFRAAAPPVERDIDGTPEPAATVQAHAQADTGPPPPPPPPDHQPLRPAVYAGDFPDPSVIEANGVFFAFATNAGGRNVQVMASTDLVDWLPPTDALPLLPAWTYPGLTWAPAVAHINGQYVMYVSLPSTMAGQCVDRFVAAQPQGPYSAVDTWPLLCNPVGGAGVIDPSPLVTSDGHVYLYWKSAGSKGRQLYVNELTPDGLHLSGAPLALLSATAGWEGGGVENPTMIQSAGKLFLFYSANWWIDQRYTMGYAVCDTPVGPCHKQGSGPWLSSRDGVDGPGGGSFFTDSSGAMWLAYVGWGGGDGYQRGGVRQLHVEPVDFSGGSPRLADRLPIGSLDGVRQVPGGVAASGWALDPDTARPIAVRLSVGAHDLGTVASSGSRPDVAAAYPQAGPAHGFSGVLPLSEGRRQVCAYAIDDVGAGGKVLGCVTVDVTDAPTGALESIVPSASGFTAAGWALDPDTAAAVTVDIYVDGVRVASGAAGGARPDVAAAHPGYGAAHGYSIAVAVPAGQHQVCAYALDDGDRPSVRLGCTTTAPGGR